MTTHLTDHDIVAAELRAACHSASWAYAAGDLAMYRVEVRRAAILAECHSDEGSVVEVEG